MYYESETCFLALLLSQGICRNRMGRDDGWVVYVKDFFLVGVDEGKRFIDTLQQI